MDAVVENSVTAAIHGQFIADIPGIDEHMDRILLAQLTAKRSCPVSVAEQLLVQALYLQRRTLWSARTAGLPPHLPDVPLRIDHQRQSRAQVHEVCGIAKPFINNGDQIRVTDATPLYWPVRVRSKW